MSGKYVPHVGDKVKVRDDADSFSVGLFYRRGDVGFVKETDGALDVLVLFDHGQWCVDPDEIDLVCRGPSLDDVIKQRDQLLVALQWIVRNPGAHPNNVQSVAKEAIALAEVAP